jgi:hypothetical protein
MGFEHYCFQTTLCFTDSIYIRHSSASSYATAVTITITDSSKQYIVKFLRDCQNQLNIKIEHKNRFMFAIIFDKKNRYIA